MLRVVTERPSLEKFIEPTGFPTGSVVKNPPAKQGTQVRFLGQKDLREEKMAANSSILAWRILWIEEPGGLQRPWCCKELDKMVRLNNNKWNSKSASGRTVSMCAVSAGSVAQSCPTLCDPMVCSDQAPLSMGFSRQYWGGLPCPPPGDYSRPRDRALICCVFCIAGRFFITEPPGNPSKCWDAPYLILFVPHYNLREEVLPPSFSSG